MSTAALSTAHLLPASPGAKGRPARSRRPALLLAGLTLVTLGGTAGAAVVLQEDAPAPWSSPVPVGVSVPVGGLELTVTHVERRKDAMTGTGTAQQPMSGPAMPMAAGAPGAGTSAGTGAMPHMPGMAGMLEHGQERVDVSVVLRSTGEDPAGVEPDRFRLYSGGEPVQLMQPPASTLSSSPLPPGAAMQGGVVLVVPEGTRPLELAYGDEPARIVLDAGPAVPGTGTGGGGGHGAGHGDGR